MQSCLEWIPVKGITMALVFVVVEMKALDRRHGPDHIIKGKIRRTVQKVNHSLQTFAGLIMRVAWSSYGEQGAGIALEQIIQGLNDPRFLLCITCSMYKTFFEFLRVSSSFLKCSKPPPAYDISRNWKKTK